MEEEEEEEGGVTERERIFLHQTELIFLPDLEHPLERACPTLQQCQGEGGGLSS